jgi:4-diphosphocytidyl-2-C-methyl-D-erythritol kinase
VEEELLSPQWLDGIALINDLERPVFEKYLLLPVMKSWLRKQEGVESAFMTGSGSTMVTMISPEAPDGTIASLRGRIAEEFGTTFWMTQTGWSGES